MRHFAPALLFAALSCRGGALATIDVEAGGEAVVPAGTLVEDLLVDFGFDSLVSMDLTAEEELANQGVAPGDITGARLVELELVAVSPAGADLSFLDSLAVFVEAPGLPAVEVAAGAEFPEGVAAVSLDLAAVDLGPYVVSQEMTLRTEISGRRPSEETTVAARVVVAVDVTAQGVRRAACGG
jgi:hypothetical protein